MPYRFPVLIALVVWTAWLSPAQQTTTQSQAPPDPHGTATYSPGEWWPSWWKVGGQVRGRLDDFSGLTNVPGGRDAFYLHRLRINSQFQVRPWLKIFAQAQDSRVAGYDRTPCPQTVTNSLDLRQAYAELGSADSGWRFRAGRQTLLFGDMRLVSTSNWGNVGPAFDAFRASYRRPGVRLDGWSSFVVLPVDGFDRPRTNRRFHGIYASFDTPDRSRTFDSYFLWKDYRLDSLVVYTYGVRSVGRLASLFTYNLEVAAQSGHAGRDSIRAWAGHWEIGHPAWHSSKAPRISGEYNYSSGDARPNDNRKGTFDQQFATNVYGTATDFGWRNLHEPVVSLDWSLRPKWKFKASYHHFWLASRQDALYTVSGAVYCRNAGAVDSRVGGEFDFRVIYQVTGHLQLWTGYAHLWAGPFLRDSGRGSVDYPYTMWTYTF